MEVRPWQIVALATLCFIHAMHLLEVSVSAVLETRRDASGSDSYVPDVIQGIGLPSGDCASVSMPHLDWAGVRTGGWTRSWAQWVNDGRGGYSCQRTLRYAAGGWGLA
mgnify:CR=1 FL=1